MKNNNPEILNDFLQLHQNTAQDTVSLIKSCPWENQKFYAEWVGQFYFFVAHATRLLAASAARLDLLNDDLHIRFLDHCQEEKHHEKLLQMDLKHLGKDIAEFKEHPMTSFLYTTQYYLIDYLDPIALLGSIMYLEGLSLTAGREIYDRARITHGEMACNFLRVHVAEDEEHIEKANKALAILTPKQLEAFTKSYILTAYAFQGLIRSLNTSTNELNSFTRSEKAA